jgi:glycosyltransferase involved in cell wall biosynthesis
MTHSNHETVYVFVDPAAGQTGVHNLGFVEVLLDQETFDPDYIALGASQQLNHELSQKLSAKGIAVFETFATQAYRFSNKQPLASELLPYTMQLAGEYGRLMSQVQSRWPNRQVCFVFHTSPWQHLQALSVAISQLHAEQLLRWQFHVYLMYWHGCDEAGAVVDRSLYFQFKQTLSRLAQKPVVHFFTSTAAYLRGYQNILEGFQKTVSIHPYFLGKWEGEPSARERAGTYSRVLAYSGAVRDIKGFDQIVPSVEGILKRFVDTKEVLVHLAKQPSESCAEWRSLKKMAQADGRLVLRCGFLTHQEMLSLVKQCNLMVLNYEPGAYANKTSGFVWMAAQLGIPCAVTANTWLEKECLRLGVVGWRIHDDQSWSPLPPLGNFDPGYRQQILQPYGDWLKQQIQTLNTEPIT